MDWASWIRTSECSSQSAVPYRLVIAQRRKGGYRDSNPGPPEPQSGALTNCAIPTIWCGSSLAATVPEGIRTPDPRLRRPLLYPAELQTHFSLSEKRVMGIEPTYPAWKAGVLPLNYTRVISDTQIILSHTCQKCKNFIQEFHPNFVIL